MSIPDITLVPTRSQPILNQLMHPRGYVPCKSPRQVFDEWDVQECMQCTPVMGLVNIIWATTPCKI